MIEYIVLYNDFFQIKIEFENGMILIECVDCVKGSVKFDKRKMVEING